MSPTEFESYLDLLSRFLRLNAAQRDEIRRELRAHLDEALEDELARGRSREEAVRRVLADFGDAAELAHRFHRPIFRRRILMQSTMAAACIGVLVLSLNLFSPSGPRLVVADGAGGTAAVAHVAKAQAPAPASGDDAATRAAEAALQRTLPEVNFDQAPFEEVIEFVRQSLGVNLHVRWSVLEESGVSRDLPISMRLKNLSVERLLRLIFADLTNSDLGFSIDEGVIIISTRENLQRRRTLEVYDVRDLIEWTHKGDASGAVADESAEDASARLTHLITTCVEPNSWAENGGEGTIERVASALVVRQSDSVHRELRAVLDELRRVAAARTNVAR